MSDSSGVSLRSRDSKRKPTKSKEPAPAISSPADNSTKMSTVSDWNHAESTTHGADDCDNYLGGDVTTPIAKVSSNSSPRANANTTTPVRLELMKSASKQQLPPGVRSVLKVYMENQLEQNAEEMQQYEELINGLVAEIEILQEDNISISERLTATTESNDKLAEDYQTLSQKNESLLLTIDEFKSQVETLQDASEMSNNLRAEVATLTADLESVRAAEVDWRNKFASQSEQLSNVKGRLSFALEEFNMLKASMVDLEAERDAALESSSTDNNELQLRITELETILQDKNYTIEELLEVGKNYEIDISALNNSINTYEEALADKDKENEFMEKTMEEVQSRYQKLQLDGRSQSEARKEIEALEAANRQKDQTNRDLVLQLDVLQTTLSEHQHQLVTLREQNMEYLNALDTYKARAVDNSERQRHAFETETTLSCQLNEVVAELNLFQKMNTELTQALEQATRRCELAEETNAVLTQEASVQRQRIENIMTGLMAVKTGHTPVQQSPRSANSTPQNSKTTTRFFPSPQDLNAAPDHSIVEARLGHVQMVIADLNASLESERAHVVAKVARIGQLSTELESARIELDVKNADLESKQIHIDRLEADRREFESKQEELIMEYSTKMKQLEVELLDALTILERKDMEMQELLEEREQLKEILLTQQRGSETAKDEFFAQLQSDKDALVAELTEVNEKNIAMYELNVANMETIEELETKLRQAYAINADQESALTAKLTLVENETAAEKESLQLDIQATVTRLTQHLAVINEEKSEILRTYSSHKERAQLLEQTLKEKNRGDIRAIEALRQFQIVLNSREQQLFEHLNSKLHVSENRIRQCQQQVSISYRAIQRSQSQKVAEYKHQIANLSASLHAAAVVAESNQLERSHLMESIKEHVVVRNELEDALEESRESLRLAEEKLEEIIEQQNQKLEGVLETNASEMNLILERLTFAENRGREMSTNSAQMFASSSRTIAYLEGECRRLTGVSDHFRAVNAKLMADLTNNTEVSVTMKALHHRLTVSSHNEDTLRNHIRSLEGTIAEKDEMILEAQESSHRVEMEFDQQLDKLHADYEDRDRQRLESIGALNHDLTLLKETLASTRESFENELEQHRFDLQESEKRYFNALEKYENLDEELVALNATLNDHADTIADLRGQLCSVEADREMLSENIESRKIEFDGAFNLKQLRIRELETTMASLRNSVQELESSNQLKDEVISSSLAKQSAFADESRELRAMVEAHSQEILKWTESYNEVLMRLQTKEDELEGIEGELHELKNVTHPESMKRAMEMENQSRNLSTEIDSLKVTLTKLEGINVQLSGTCQRNEHKLHLLQTELAASQGEAQAMQTKNNGLIQDNQYLHVQLDDMTLKFATMTREIGIVRAHLSARENEIELNMKRISELESNLLQTDGQCNNFELTQEALSVEMRVFYDYLCSVENGTAVELPSAIKDESVYTNDSGARSNIDSRTAINLASEFFASPVTAGSKASMHSMVRSGALSDAITPYSVSKVGVTPRSYPLYSVKQSYDEIRNKAVTLLQYMQRVKDSLEIVTAESTEYCKRANVAELELASASHKLLELQSELATSNVEIEKLQRYSNDLASSRAELIDSADEFSRVMISGLSNLDSFVADITARANTHLIGRLLHQSHGDPVPISISIPNNIQTKPIHDPSQPLSIDFGVASLFQVSVSIVEGTMQSFSHALEAVLADSAYKSQSLESLELFSRDNERGWAKERMHWQEQVANQSSELASLADAKMSLENDIEHLERESDKLRVLLREYSTQREDLEAEYRASIANVNNLQAAFTEAEAVCLDLQSRLRSVQAENVAKTEEIHHLTEQVESTQRRAISTETLLQKIQSDCDRLKTERDSISTVRKTLEIELERARLDLSNAAAQAHNRIALEEEAKAKFALEKLLSALGSTLDLISGNFSAPGMSGINVSAIDLDQSGLLAHQAQQSGLLSPIADRLRGSMSGNAAETSFFSADGSEVEGKSPSMEISRRVDLAVKRLGDIRAWSRDESRHRRAHLEKIDLLMQELSRAKKVGEETSAELRLSMSKEMERNAELKERSREIIELKELLHKNHEEFERNRKELATASAHLEEEKKLKNKLQAEIQTKDSEIRKFASKWEHSEATQLATQEELVALNTRFAELSAEYESCTELLKATKANNARLSSSLGLLEKGLDKDMSDRGALQQRLSEVQDTAAGSIRLKLQVTELETTLVQSRLQLKQVSTANESLEVTVKQLNSDNDSLRRKLSSFEIRLEQALKEKFEFQQENAEYRLELAKVTQLCEIESANKTKAEVALAMLSKDSRARHATEDYTALVEEVEGKFQIDEDEKNVLRHSNHSLKLALEEKDSQKHADQLKISKLEKELALIKSKLSRSAVELLEANNKASSLRAQGRKARTLVLDIAGDLKVLVDMVRCDAPAVLGNGVDLSFLLENEPVATAAAIGLEEALGVPELQSITKQLKVAISAVHQPGRAKNLTDIQVTCAQLEAENSKLLESIMQIEAQNEEQMNKLRDELQRLQIELVEMRRYESVNKQVNKQLAALESIIKQEREEKERAVTMLNKLKSENDSMNKEIASLKWNTTHTVSSSLQGEMQEEIERLRQTISKAQDDLFVARQEISSMNHHRTLLRDTIDQLERSLRSKSEALAEFESNDKVNNSRSFTRNSNANGVQSGGTPSSSSDDQHLRQIARLRARVSCMDQVIAVYRAGILAMYPDGSSYGAAQYAGLLRAQAANQSHAAHSFHNSKSSSTPTSLQDVLQNHWLTREMALIRRSYEEEIRLLEGEVGEVKGRLKQNVSYVQELRKRFEDNMKILYRNGQDRVNEGLMAQIDHLTTALARAEQDSSKLSAEIDTERHSGRKRHAVLVEELSKALSTEDALAALIRRFGEIENCDATIDNFMKHLPAEWSQLWSEIQARSVMREDSTIAALDRVAAKSSTLQSHHSSRKVAVQPRTAKDMKASSGTGDAALNVSSQFDVNAVQSIRELDSSGHGAVAGAAMTTSSTFGSSVRFSESRRNRAPSFEDRLSQTAPIPQTSHSSSRFTAAVDSSSNNHHGASSGSYNRSLGKPVGKASSPSSTQQITHESTGLSLNSSSRFDAKTSPTTNAGNKPPSSPTFTSRYSRHVTTTLSHASGNQ